MVGRVLWAGPKGAKVLLPDDTVGFMPSREAPFAIRDALEDRAPAASREVRARWVCTWRCNLPGGVLHHRQPSLTCWRTAAPSAAAWAQAPCVPKGLVRTFRVMNVPAKGAGKGQSGPLLSARQCDLDVLWRRASQLCDISVQVWPAVCSSGCHACSQLQARDGCCQGS